jgi:hypothetical protein
LRRPLASSLLALVLLTCATAAIDSASPAPHSEPSATASPSVAPTAPYGPLASPTAWQPPTPGPTPTPPTWADRLEASCPADKVPQPSGEAQTYARSLVTASEWRCMWRVIQYESRWRLSVVNPYSGACGLPQALPCSKLSDVVPDWATNARGSVDWAMAYVHKRYGSWYGAAFHKFGGIDQDGRRWGGYAWY